MEPVKTVPMPPSVAETGLPEERRKMGRGYPARYYVANPYSPGEVAYIVAGLNMFIGGGMLEPEKRKANPATLNRLEGITPAQSAAMQWVADMAAETEHWRWDDPHADPMRYNAAGEFLGG